MSNEKKKKKSDIIIKIVIVAMVVALAATLCMKFYQIINGNKGVTKKSASLTEAEKLMNRNLDAKYPNTPTAVVDVYCSITKELHGSYKKELPQEQVTKLYSQLRVLMDDELLKNNDYKKHLAKLNKELEQYRKDKMFISRYTVQDHKEVKCYVQDDGKEYTKVQISYSIKKESNWLKQNEQVILRKDEDGRWKILGVEVSTATSDEDEE